jgi:prolipoprotein diacylglyceryltransferase
VFISLLSGVIGARLGYVLEFPSAFSENPLNIASLNLDLFNLYVGLGVGLVIAIIYGKRNKLPLWSTLDTLTPLFATFLIAYNTSNLASGNAFGSPTELPWGIDLWGTIRHPTQVYDIIFSIGILVVIVAIFIKKQDYPDGMIFLFFLACTASARIFTEAFRGDSVLIFNGIRIAQVYAWLILAFSLWALGKRIIDKNDTSKNEKNQMPTNG